MKTITLPAGTDHIKFSEMAHMIADAIWPVTCEDDERWGYVGARINLDAELKQAVRTEALPVKDPLTLGPHTFPIGNMLLSALVAVPDLTAYVAARGIAVVMEAPEQTPQPQPKQESANEWVSDAQSRAHEIIKERRAVDQYPSQENMADQIAREFRAAGRVGADGKPISGAYIKRWALKGISSAIGKQLSTSNRQSK